MDLYVFKFVYKIWKQPKIINKLKLIAKKQKYKFVEFQVKFLRHSGSIPCTYMSFFQVIEYLYR